jgi:glucose-6-phosphate isomerase
LDDTLSLNDLDTDINPKKILIVYYSRTGNTETIAKYIEEIT